VPHERHAAHTQRSFRRLSARQLPPLFGDKRVRGAGRRTRPLRTNSGRVGLASGSRSLPPGEATALRARGARPSSGAVACRRLHPRPDGSSRLTATISRAASMKSRRVATSSASRLAAIAARSRATSRRLGNTNRRQPVGSRASSGRPARGFRTSFGTLRDVVARSRSAEDRRSGRRSSRLAGTSYDGETRTRTGDTTIFSRVLYQLSYLAVVGGSG
jgi:hypothetical protein